MVKMLRTRNRFSASSVDQIPHQLVAWQLYGHQLLLPIPDIDRTSYFLVFGANPMASNGSLMTVPDFPQPAARAQGARRPDGRRRPAPHRDRQGRRRAPLRPARLGRRASLLAMVHTLFEEGLTRPAPYVDRVDRVRELRRAVHPRARRAGQRHRRRTTYAGWPASSPRPTGARGVRSHRCLHDRLRIPGAVGHPVPQHPHRPLRPAGRRAVHRAGHRLRRHGGSSAPATTTCGAAGCAASRSTAASSRPR